jgi:hypothetical protein
MIEYTESSYIFGADLQLVQSTPAAAGPAQTRCALLPEPSIISTHSIWEVEELTILRKLLYVLSGKDPMLLRYHKTTSSA